MKCYGGRGEIQTDVPPWRYKKPFQIVGYDNGTGLYTLTLVTARAILKWENITNSNQSKTNPTALTVDFLISEPRPIDRDPCTSLTEYAQVCGLLTARQESPDLTSWDLGCLAQFVSTEES